MSFFRAFLAIFALLLLGAAAPEPVTLIRGAHVFDGSGSPAVPADVLLRGERIAAIGQRLRAPRGARVIEARGMTLLPGLQDLHTHLRSPGTSAPDDLPKAWAAHLLHGVTSVADFSVSGEMLAPIRQLSATGAVAAPHLALAIRFGVPQGHGTEYGWGDVFTRQVTTPRAAELAMDRALAYRPDVIKVFADGWRYGRSPDLDSMNLPTLRTIVERAHEAGIPVITHTVTLAGAKLAARAGVDALGHGIGDAPVDDELIALMRASGTAYVPTMAVYEPQAGRALLVPEAARLSAVERAYDAAERAADPPTPEYEARRWEILQDNLRRLKAGGVAVGVGTDAGIGGVYQGSSAIREIRLLAQFGLTPAEALAAATSVSADIMMRGAHSGRIAPGMRADLLLVRGRPDLRLDDLYAVERVFVAGRPTDLAALRRAVERDGPSPLPALRMTGPIDTVLRADGRTDLGTLPDATNEAGTDHSHLHAITAPDAPPRRLLYAKFGAAPAPFANFIIPLTPGAVQPADASGFTGIAFTARGTGRYELLLDEYGRRSSAAFRAPFDGGASLGEVRLPFSAFASGEGGQPDLGRLRALVFRLHGEPGGEATLELGTVRFYRD